MIKQTHSLHSGSCELGFQLSKWVLLAWIMFHPNPNLYADWALDFEQQNPINRPTLESRYASSERDSFHIEASLYSITFALKQPGGHRIDSVEQYGNAVIENGCFELTDSEGGTWNTQLAETPSRVNLYRRGPYYHEIHWLDVAWQNDQGSTLPVKGEIIFYCYPEFFRCGIVLHPTEEVSLKKLSFQMTGLQLKPVTKKPKEFTADTLVLENRKGATAWFPTIEPHGRWSFPAADTGLLTWDIQHTPPILKPDRRLTFGFGFIPLKNESGIIKWDPLRAQLTPLQGEQLTLLNGLSFQFDHLRGDYAVATHNPGSFSYHYYESPNGYLRAKARIHNNDIPRKIYLRHEVGTGSKGQVECGVVLDEADELMPMMTQISKNFSGEKEEKFYNPADTPFSEIIFPLHFDKNEERTFSSLQLYQNWGNHPLKQFSSLGAWMDYYHMSTGVTETTCYVPFKFYTGISIADLRGMSGTMWTSQPQHDNVGGHLFLEYHPKDQPGKKVALEYVGTDFHSTGPAWAHVTLHYLSEDGRLKVSLEAFEFPQLDELRSFIRLSMEALDDIPIEDWATDFRIMQIDTRTQSLRYQKVTWTDASDQTITREIALNDTWTLKGEALSKRAPTAILWSSPKGNNAFIVEDWHGTIGGKDVARLGVSCEGRKDLNTNLVLHPLTGSKGWVRGDMLELDLFIMPFGKENTDFQPALTERNRYGLNPVKVTAYSNCEVLSSFPPRLLWKGHAATFELQGGYSTITMQVEGLPDYTNWRIQKMVGQQWEDIHHGNPKSEEMIQGEGQQRYVGTDGKFGISFRFNVNGENTRYRLVRH